MTTTEKTRDLIRVGHGSRLTDARWYYEPTFLRDDQRPDSTGECSLFVRQVGVIETRTGRRRVAIERDVEWYPDEGALVDGIESRDMRELTEGQAAGLGWVPSEWADLPVRR